MKKYYIPYDVHFNKQGNKLLAKKLLEEYFPERRFQKNQQENSWLFLSVIEEVILPEATHSVPAANFSSVFEIINN